ncbi:MAG: glycosyltransferase family 2 protein [Lachnospiraceae bacterium]|nr:glycosyltransferase family 2 protein [Lachnospiraceae bacterium]
MPKVSIVIPVYNTAEFLPQCLNSLIEQTYHDIEIICVNDGSTDCSLEILNDFAKKDKRVKVYTKENEGKGAASARNLGMENATGMYIQFLDSDDFFEEEMIECLVQKAEESKADIVIYRANRYDNKLQKITQEYASIQLQYMPGKECFSYCDCPEKIYQIGDLIAWNKMYRRKLLLQYDLKFEPIPISDDQYLPTLALVLAERITCIDRAFVNYRFNTGSSQVDSQSKHPEAAYAATYSIVAKLKEYGIYEKVKRSYLNMAIRLMREYFDKMTEYRTMKFLYDIYLNEVFPMLGAKELSVDYFYDKRIGEWYELINSTALEEIVFQSARGYGGQMTTAILRFQCPYEQITRGSKIVLVGKGIVGRYWYAQLILSAYCEVAVWVDSIEDIPNDLHYDSILITK